MSVIGKNKEWYLEQAAKLGVENANELGWNELRSTVNKKLKNSQDDSREEAANGLFQKHRSTNKALYQKPHFS